MELPKGQMNNVVANPTTKITCPVVETYKRKGKERTLNRPKPASYSGISFDPNVSMEQIEKFWILSALDYCDGRIQKAADMIGVSKETVYRKLREYNK